MLVLWTRVCHPPHTALDLLKMAEAKDTQTPLMVLSWGHPTYKEAIYVEGFT